MHGNRSSALGAHLWAPKDLFQARGVSVVRSFLHLLLPPACQLCAEPLPLDSPTAYLCPTCISACIQTAPAACPVCAEPYPAPVLVPHPCPQCSDNPPHFTWLKSIGIHAHELQHAVHELKYAGRFHLAQPLAQLLFQRLHKDIETFAPQTIIPVPLHPQRLRQRGFNQSLLVGKHLGAALGVEVNPHYLVRIRPTRSQTDLNRKQRYHNLKGAFALKGSLHPRRILLIDDVVTTTATCRECATTLTGAGHEVAVVALGRARLLS